MAFSVRQVTEPILPVALRLSRASVRMRSGSGKGLPVRRSKYSRSGGSAAIGPQLAVQRPLQRIAVECLKVFGVRSRPVSVQFESAVAEYRICRRVIRRDQGTGDSEG